MVFFFNESTFYSHSFICCLFAAIITYLLIPLSILSFGLIQSYLLKPFFKSHFTYFSYLPLYLQLFLFNEFLFWCFFYWSFVFCALLLIFSLILQSSNRNDMTRLSWRCKHLSSFTCVSCLDLFQFCDTTWNLSVINFIEIR